VNGEGLLFVVLAIATAGNHGGHPYPCLDAVRLVQEQWRNDWYPVVLVK
jgi:hypothetical protein